MSHLFYKTENNVLPNSSKICEHVSKLLKHTSVKSNLFPTSGSGTDYDQVSSNIIQFLTFFKLTNIKYYINVTIVTISVSFSIHPSLMDTGQKMIMSFLGILFQFYMPWQSNITSGEHG